MTVDEIQINDINYIPRLIIQKVAMSQTEKPVATPETIRVTPAAPIATKMSALATAPVVVAKVAPKATPSPVVKKAVKKAAAPAKPSAKPLVKAAIKVATKSSVKTKAVSSKAVPKPAATVPLKTTAKVSSKPAAKAPSKALPKAKVKATVKAVAKPKVDKLVKAKKPKLVRDSFTIPQGEYAVLKDLKQRAGKLSNHAKKSEFIRAGIKALAAMSDTALLAALKAVPAIKTGRPAKS
jgi:hypothetical protein